MIDLFVLMLFTFIMSCFVERICTSYDSVYVGYKKNKLVKLIVMTIIISLSLFSGLRTSYNDTSTYIHGYSLITDNIDWNVLINPYGGFALFQSMIKGYIGSNPQFMLLISSFIVNISFVIFFVKYSKHFKMTMLCYFILGPYIFSMAGIKQALSMAICLFGIDALLNKKIKTFFTFLLIASMFHPYILCLVVLPWLMNRIWDKRMCIILCLLVIIIANVDVLLSLAKMIGKDYKIESLIGNTVNPFRVMIEFVPIVLCFSGKNIINRYDNKLLTLGVNMMCINGLMILMGLFYNPIYFGRIGTYFSSCTAVIMPIMLNVLYKNNKNKVGNLLIIYSLFFIYFLLDLTKLGSISVFTDIFKHTSLISLFS